MSLSPLRRAIRRTITVFVFFVKAAPRRSALLIGSLLLAGLLEGIGIAALLPLLDIVLVGDGESMSAIGRHTESMLQLVGLTPTLGSMLAIIVVMIVSKAALLVFAARQIGYTAAFVTMLLRQRLLQAFMEARWSFFVQNRTGSLTAAMSSEPARAAACFVQICRILTGFIQVLVYVGLAIAVSWEVSIAAISVGVFTVVLLNRFVIIVGRAGQKQTGLNRSLLSQLIDGLQTMKSIKSMGREESLSRFLSDDIKEMNRLQRLQIASKEALNHYRDPIATIALAGFVYLLISFWELAPGNLIVMALLFMRIASRISGLQSAQQGVAGSLPGFWFIRAVLTSASVSKERLHGGAAPDLKQHITLRAVNFSYGRKKVLSDVDLTIDAGSFIAVIGPSGSGKTTLADVVIGLLSPQSGDVLVDDTPLEAIDTRQWRRSIGYVPQETVLFHDTIFNNVTLGEASITPDEVRDALERAGAWNFVEQQPKGVDTVVGERGAKLSGGQRQRIAIARALVRKPKLLVLDEATTALDPQTEAAICDSLRQLSGKITILAISHQPAMRNAADIAYSLNTQTRKLEIVSPEESKQAILETTE